ncbi:chemotaxis protein CheA [Biomaibacter acetigenes]|uniref:Chemotaxis protein CheA n=1 Tax=Biomaibacter acetigenes TaxID=2316383 RepID=A0A3G2R8P6_9FIRM|nr:chemotaxis protein CheA [Biomaibacter acetigenes]AYO31755.1 chemotaxis protein CheA [Biomaibacter acetigenes]
MAGIFESSEMIGAFLDETEEQLQLLEQSILELEQKGETPEIVQKLFRIAHTLKGSSSAMGFEKMKLLTHEMENVLDRVRNHLLKISKPVINVLFQCLDHLRMLKEDFVSDRKDIKTDIAPIINSLREVLPEKYNEVDTGKTKDESNQFVEFTLGSDQQAQLEQAVKSGLNVLICHVKISEGSLMKSARACLILNYFNELGTVIYTDPDVLETPDDAEIDRVSYLVITQMDASTFEAKSRDELMDIDEVKVVPFYGETLQNYKQPEKAQQKETDIDTTSKTANYEKRVTQTVRVDVERLEKMMNLVGELVIEQARILQVGNILHNRYSSDDVIDDLLGISNRVSRVIGELQEGVMKSRMLPIQQLFNRFPRMVRDLSESLNKQVELILEGGDTEMDRTIIEEITDPLIHLIRNAIDHGIETPDIRKKTGKPLKGILRITAFHQENHVILTIEDDGRGIDLRKVKQAAIKKQIITSQDAENLTEQEVINLIFHTGFSTSQTVNDISGRGVGMDIVRNHVDRLNGIIDVETKQGEGTKFTIKLPLTLAILTGLLVKINDETYALPMSNVIEIVRKPEREIEFVKGQAVSVIREKVLPLIWLHDYFNIPRRKRGRNVFIVVLGVAEKRLGLVVDELVGNQEVVVKPLGMYIGKIEGFSGATILGDGSVACILDVVGISKMVSSRKVTAVDDYQNCDIEVGDR